EHRAFSGIRNSASGNDKPYRSVIVTCEPVITFEARKPLTNA
ncbi:unnamed protein product, partial [Schistosoma curassoni]|uniref:Pyridoxamine 5'-phosphate oxidase family protein n=1 Tax=Schistosoma curassoni TaxID=6186 RepID=A0A183KJN1_9TREM